MAFTERAAPRKAIGSLSSKIKVFIGGQGVALLALTTRMMYMLVLTLQTLRLVLLLAGILIRT